MTEPQVNSGPEFPEPTVVDKRRVDPRTGKLRYQAAAAEGAKAEQSAGHGAEKVEDLAGNASFGGNPAPETAEAVGTAATPAGPEAETPETGPETPPSAKENPAQADDIATQLEAAQAQIGNLGDELARAKADLYNLQNEYRAYVRRSKAEAPVFRQAGIAEVVEALMGVLDDISLARQHGDLTTGPLASILENMEAVLATRFDVERYGEVGEAFDPEIHDALSATPQAGVNEDQIGAVAQPGYRMGEKVLRHARVMVITTQ